MQRIILIIPTLNEAENIEQIVRAFLEKHEGLQVIVADSDSPDGTAAAVEQAFAGDERVGVQSCAREKGRGAAIAEVYEQLVERDDWDIVATSDADFSHDPKDFPALLAALEQADVVIGSRYLPQSEIIGWPWSRRVFSKMANWYAERLLGAKVHDYTNGYRVFTRRALEVLDLARLDADGFIMLSQELVQWKEAGMRIVEVPTRFVNRERGASNFRLELVMEAFREVRKLARAHRSKGAR